MRFACLCWILICAVASGVSADEARREPVVTPERVTLTGPDARWQVLVSGWQDSDLNADWTRRVVWRSRNPEIASVSDSGLVRAVSDGSTVLEITADEGGFRRDIPVVVRGTQSGRALHFENDILPVLSRFACNTSGCHGKAEGQNGFKLSIFGFDPPADLASLTQEGRGRRTFAPVPEQSLLLLKASGGMPHGGGIRIRPDTDEYRLLRDWVRSGCPTGAADAPKLVSIRVLPRESRLALRYAQQLQVTAVWSDGREVDVTHHARFQSNNEGLARVDDAGLISTGETPGEAAIMASYMGAVDVFRAVMPQLEHDESLPAPPVLNFIDELVDARLKKLGIQPSGMCRDEDFLRRAYLDVAGVLPTADEARAFLRDQSPDRRARLIDALLKRPEHADLEALRWADVLRVDRLALGHKQAGAFYHWIRDSFAQNKPVDAFTREIITAEGLLTDAPQGSLFKVVSKPGEMASTISQVFLGVRIECAQCHHHPFDRWGQDDYVGMQAFFAQVGFKKTPAGDLLRAAGNPDSRHPRTNEVVTAHALLQSAPEKNPEGDRRRVFADWLTAPDNPWFARNIVNRVWARLTGRGLVEPVDDFRMTNPPSNPELLDALARHFVASGFDLHALTKTIAASRTYQLSTEPNRSNERDEQNFSRALFRPLEAEVRLDMVCQVTGVPEKFDGVAVGSRAVQLWDSQVNHDFLRLFGRPVRVTACQCERIAEPTVSQVLHVLNSPNIQAKLSDEGGRLARLDATLTDSDALADELYLTVFSRFPDVEERQAVSRYLAQAPNRRQAMEDVVWSLMNTVEFLFNH